MRERKAKQKNRSQRNMKTMEESSFLVCFFLSQARCVDQARDWVEEGLKLIYISLHGFLPSLGG